MERSSPSPRTLSWPSVSCALLLAACLLFPGVSRAAPCITLSKKSGPPTSKILVSGRGFEPHAKVDIYFDKKDEKLVVTNGQGDFKGVVIRAPRCARPGKHWVTALERNNHERAQKPFLVQTDWAQFRFDADGTRLNPYENVLRPNNVRDLRLRWRYQTGTQGDYSYPAIVGGIVYVGSEYPNFGVLALDAQTGAKIWFCSTRWYVEFSPAVAAGVVYVGSEDYNVYALDSRTGRKLWSYTTGGKVDSSPAVADGLVYVGSGDGHVYALNARTGTKLWSYATNGYVYSSPTVAHGVVYVGSLDGNLYALNAKTGTFVWSYDAGQWILTAPAVADGVVYFGDNGGRVFALDVRSGDQVWFYQTGNAVASSPAVANGVIYVGSLDKNLYALSATTGDVLWWFTTDYWVNSSPAVADGAVYVCSYDGSIYAFSLKDGFREGLASKRPESGALRPDLSLKVSNWFATPASH